MSTNLTDEYGTLLESLEIPVKPLQSRSYRTPEWEVLNDIRQRFDIPSGIATRAPLADYLSKNVALDDFFSFLGFLIQPFARMVVDIYSFLHQHGRSASSGQTITEIRIGARTAFPVDLKFMPRELLKVLTETLDVSWNVNALKPLHNLLPMIEPVARCDGKFGSKVCRPDCFQYCREGISHVATDVTTILQSDAKSIDGPDVVEPLSNNGSAEGSEPLHLTSTLRDILQSFIAAHGDVGSSEYKSASDCLPGQRPGVPPGELYTQKYIANVRDVLGSAKTKVKTHREEIKEFLKLPYWRRRNDLYEVWVLTKVCSQFQSRGIQLCNIDSRGHWNIPGNGQGQFAQPTLKIFAPSGRYQVFTGLKMKNFQLLDEGIGKGLGAMPDWLFCREVHDFDFDLYNEETDRLKRYQLVPEFIVECKAGRSYPLLKTIENTMKRRYLPLLRTDRGMAVLVNYRAFFVPHILDKNSIYRDSVRRMYTRILGIDSFAPQSSAAEKEFAEAVRSVFAIDEKVKSGRIVDLVLVIDTTGSMDAYMPEFRDGWRECVQEIGEKDEDTEIGVVAVGDHADKYDIQVFPLSDKSDEAIQFVTDVPATHGHDPAEAYEDALHVLAAFPWRPHAERLVVFVGDAFPHPASDCPFKYDWRDELARLAEIGVIINSIRFPDGPESERFFNQISSQTNGANIEVRSGSDALEAIRNCVAMIKTNPQLSR